MAEFTTAYLKFLDMIFQEDGVGAVEGGISIPYFTELLQE